MNLSNKVIEHGNSIYSMERNSEALVNAGVQLGSPRSQIIIACDLR